MSSREPPAAPPSFHGSSASTAGWATASSPPAAGGGGPWGAVGAHIPAPCAPSAPAAKGKRGQGRAAPIPAAAPPHPGMCRHPTARVTGNRSGGPTDPTKCRRGLRGGSSRAGRGPPPRAPRGTRADVERCAVAGGRGEVGDLDGDVADVASRVALLCPTEAEVGVGWAPRELQVGGGAGHGSGFGAQAGGAQRPTAPILQPRDADHGPRPRRHQLARKGRIGAHHHPQLSRPLVHPQGCGCWERQWGHRGAMGTAALPEAPPVPRRPRRCRWGLRAALRPAGVFRSAAAHALLGARPHPVRTAAVPFLFTPPLLPPHVPPPALTSPPLLCRHPTAPSPRLSPLCAGGMEEQ